MAWYPHAVRKPVTRFKVKMKPNRINLHTAVSNSTSLFSFFNQPKQVCSHFYVREDGTVEQYVPINVMAAADLEGNRDTVSIETWDGYRRVWGFHSGSQPLGWNNAQLLAMANLLAWISNETGIPLTLLSNSLPGRRGVSYHRLGIDPWRTKGGLKFSNSRGKVCPGDARIAQVPNLVTMAVLAASPGGGGRSGPLPLSPIARGYSVAYVKEVQTLLNYVTGSKLLVDGLLGPVTVGAVKAYQESRALFVDGDPGPLTMRRLRDDAARKREPVAPPAPKPHSDIFPLRVDGVWGAVTTKALQIRLSVPATGVLSKVTIQAMQTRLSVPADGDFGPVTKARLQSYLGVSVDKWIGPATVRALQARLNTGKF